ncbi:hypothetical protein BH11BAC5_BH11BAC5_41450 [soil metagenome]
MRSHLDYATKMIMSVILFFTINIVTAQLPPQGKYNTTNYPEDRKAIEALGMIQDSTAYLNDDYISVGAEGMVYYGRMQEENSFKKYDLKFKSVTPVPGTQILRIFGGKTAISNAILNVVFSSSKGDLYVKVIRSATYVKQMGKWYLVFGQGTPVQTEAEMEESMKKSLQKN